MQVYKVERLRVILVPLLILLCFFLTYLQQGSAKAIFIVSGPRYRMKGLMIFDIIPGSLGSDSDSDFPGISLEYLS